MRYESLGRWSDQAGTCLALLVEDEEALKRIEIFERFESEGRTEIMTGTGTPRAPSMVSTLPAAVCWLTSTRQGFAGRERGFD